MENVSTSESYFPSYLKILSKIETNENIIPGVIPPQDYDFLFKARVASMFASRTRLSVATLEVCDEIDAKIKEMQS